ncbi:MAG: hypothetical protein PSX81_02010 [bacterium]|nr:hypothetical protein [bacterium]
MMKYLAWFFSVLFHPLILLNLGISVLLLFHPYYNSKYYDEQLVTLVIYMAVNTLVMPLLVIVLLKRFKYLDSYTIATHKQRTFPYIIIAVLMAVTAYQLYNNEMGGLPMYFLIGSTICLFLNAIITLKFGISSHTIAAGGLVALMFYVTAIQHIAQMEYYLVISILIAGITGSSRLYLNAHTTKQIYWGYLLGFGVVIATLSLF